MTTPDERRQRPPIELPVAECMELLSTTTVGRIAYVDGAGQQLVPVNFVVVSGEVYFRTTADGMLARLAQGHPDVAFGVDHHEDLYRNGWNVTVRGSAHEVTDPDLHDAVLNHSRLRPWAGGDRTLVIGVHPEHVDGRRVSGH